ncbi:hypothetical protein [Salinactinospora qingdaonensis]|uniref:Uncharacterized protein n=1 Tax=Salinactinospora qingdaonensis TaxID=702744 RepID=A0ABP7FY37_9ACTN
MIQQQTEAHRANQPQPQPRSRSCRACGHPPCRAARARRAPRRWGRSLEFATEHAHAASLQRRFPGAIVWWGEAGQTYRALLPDHGLIESAEADNLSTLLRCRMARPQPRGQTRGRTRVTPRSQSPNWCLTGTQTPRPHHTYGATSGTWQPTP